MGDVNGTQMHLLLTEQDWNIDRVSEEGETVENLEWSAERGLALRRRLEFRGPSDDAVLSFDDRRGADRDRYGTWWIVGDDRASIESRRGDVTNRWPGPGCPSQPFVDGCEPTEGAPAAVELGGLVVTDDHRLVVGTLHDPGFLVFDLVGGGAPRFVRWVHSPTFHPIDLCRRPGGGIAVLDADHTLFDARIWELDRRLQPIATEDAPEQPSFVAECEPEPGPDPDAQDARAQRPRRVVSLTLPDGVATALALLQDRDFIVLYDDSNTVVRFAVEQDGLEGNPTLATVATSELDTSLQRRVARGEPTAVRGHDLTVLDGESPTLFVLDKSGTRVFAFDIDDDRFEARAENYPLRNATGRAIVAADEDAWFEATMAWHPLLERIRPRYKTAGQLITPVFDGRLDDTRWHRVFIDGCIPGGTSVVVESRAANTIDELDLVPWRQEPHPYLRRGDLELPFDIDVRRSEQGHVGTWELLVQRTDGRFAQFRIILEGNGTLTPKVAAARFTYGRFSYLHEYLPEIYHERDRDTRFLERYLANPEGLLTDLEGRIADAQLLFDARTVPEDYLDWLASWLGTVFDADMPQDRKRLFLRHAIEMYRRRGTIPGLIAALTLTLSECPDDAFTAELLDQPFGIRILEANTTRRLGVPIPDGPGQIGATIVTAPEDRWTPDLGASVLHARYARHLAAQDPPLPPRPLPPTTPVNEAEAAAWKSFLSEQLGVRDPHLDAADHVGLFRRFLLQRYRQPGRLPTEFEADHFDTVSLPTSLPASEPAIIDWFEFVTLVVPITEAAHHFTVLLPVDLDASLDDQNRIVHRATRVVEVERPLHTTVDVRPYWAAFQLGDARLGFDTAVGQSARTTSLVLGRDEFASSHLTTFTAREAR